MSHEHIAPQTMSQFFQIHPDNPQKRLTDQVVEMLRQGAVVVYPTDSGYALGCHIEDKQALDRIRAIRRLDDRHNFTLVCSDLSEISTYAKVDNTVYRLLKSATPGAYTFILEATREVPRRLQSRRKTIGIRVPDNAIAQALLEGLGEPIMSTTLILPGETIPESDPYEIRQSLEHAVDLIIDGGYGSFEPTTVIDLTGDVPEVTRRGLGDPSPFEA
jgi:tRNA threonylcarbamoyl adenosine modification protein (Sua5/YciO/YrdC/YwlC family)